LTCEIVHYLNNTIFFEKYFKNTRIMGIKNGLLKLLFFQLNEIIIEDYIYLDCQLSNIVLNKI